MNKLLQSLLKNLEDNKAWTENGALSNKSTKSAVLDFFYHQPARLELDSNLFSLAMDENILLTTKALFYLRNVRGGQGKRLSFRQALSILYKNYPEIFEAVVSLVPQYGRWDDILVFAKSPRVVELVKTQLREDFNTKNPSLLTKWMPSENASSQKTKALARQWQSILGLSARDYRHLLTLLRGRINIVETQMSDNSWDEINYERVPSRAAMIYRKAFSRHDGERYVEYLEAVKSGKKKINAGALFPVDIVAKYRSANGGNLQTYSYHRREFTEDETLEAQWKALPNFAEGDYENALVVADVSGSMEGGQNPHAKPIDVCLSLAIYLAEKNNGAFQNYFLTFSDNSKLQKVSGRSLIKKLTNLNSADWGGSTNVQSAFEEILSHAVKNNVPEKDMPKRIIIISDMQFNSCINGTTNLEAIEKKYKKAGYKLPDIVFWNVDSRVNEAPATKDENGVYLVSGYSPSIYKVIVGGQADNPYELMLEALNDKMYLPVQYALESLLVGWNVTRVGRKTNKPVVGDVTKKKPRKRLDKIPF